MFIVDDNEDAALLLSEALTEKGHLTKPRLIRFPRCGWSAIFSPKLFCSTSGSR